MANIKFVISMFGFFFICMISMALFIHYSLENIAKIVFVIFLVTFQILFFYLVFATLRSERYRHYFTKITKKNFLPMVVIVFLIFAVVIFSYFQNIDVIGIVFSLAFFIFIARGIFLQFYSIRKKAKNKLLIIPMLMLTIGMFGFLSGFFVSGYMRKIIPDSFEMPLGSLEGLAVDSEGNIYCGAQFYSRVQVYDIEGKFLYGKFLDASGGAFKIKINDNDQLEIMIYRGNKKLLFDKDGSLLSQRKKVPNYKAGFEQVKKK